LKRKDNSSEPQVVVRHIQMEVVDDPDMDTGRIILRRRAAGGSI
jgi:hypothetical protein